MWKNKYKKIKYSKSYGIGFGGYLSAVIGIVSIARKMNGYEKYTDVGIAIASIGVLSAITISYITSESRKISDLVRYFIISNEFYQVYTDENGKEKVEYFPCVEQKYDDDNIYVRFRIDGSKIGQKLRNQEQALADCFETLCIDVIDERGYITYVLQKNKEEQIVVHSIEELPQPEMGYLQVGNTLIDWMNCPHMLVTGITRSGKTTLIKILMRSLSVQGVRLYYLDPKNDREMKHYCKSNNVKYYSTIDEIKNVLDEIEEEMRLRQKDLDAMKLKEAEFNPVYIFFDELIAYAELVGSKKYQNDVLNKISSVIVQGAGKRMYLALISQRGDTKYISGSVRDSIGIRIAMARQTETAYSMVFPDIQGVKNYRTEKGTGLIYRTGYDTRPKELIVPYIQGE